MSTAEQNRRDVKFVPNKHGGMLKYFGKTADAEHWDTLWEQQTHKNAASRAEQGHLPRQLRATFRQWVPRGSRVLEAGCGRAHFTLAANALGYSADGMDFAPRVITRLQKEYPHIRFFDGDVRNLIEVQNDTYDAVYLPGVCEHFEEGPEQIIDEMHRILAPNGVLLLSTPCFNGFRMFLHKLGAFRKPVTGPFYQYAFSQEDMATRLRDHGFEVVQIFPYGTLNTLVEHVPLLRNVPLGTLRKPIAVILDKLPLIREWGHGCVWVARKPGTG